MTHRGRFCLADYTCWMAHYEGHGNHNRYRACQEGKYGSSGKVYSSLERGLWYVMVMVLQGIQSGYKPPLPGRGNFLLWGNLCHTPSLMGHFIPDICFLPFQMFHLHLLICRIPLVKCMNTSLVSYAPPEKYFILVI